MHSTFNTGNTPPVTDIFLSGPFSNFIIFYTFFPFPLLPTPSLFSFQNKTKRIKCNDENTKVNVRKTVGIGLGKIRIDKFRLNFGYILLFFFYSFLLLCYFAVFVSFSIFRTLFWSLWLHFQN